MSVSPLNLEWLETDGLGGYASLSGAMGPARRYHGLLVPNLPNLGPHVMLQRLEPMVILASGRRLAFTEMTYEGGVRCPKGADKVADCGGRPWAQTTWEEDGLKLRMSVLMPRRRAPWRPLENGENPWPGGEVLIRYEVLAAPAGLLENAILRLTPFVPARSAHAQTKSNLDLNARGEFEAGRLHYQPYAGLPPVVVETGAESEFHHSPDWHNNILYPLDAARGYTSCEDVFTPGFFELPLRAAMPALTVRAGLRRSGAAPQELWEKAAADAQKRPRPLGLDPAAFLAQLPGQGASIIAGYPWFGAWGRDTAISVPGLCFSQGQLDEGLDLLCGLLSRAKGGLVANLFGADGAGADNAVDATLLALWACGEYLKAGGTPQMLSARAGADITRILAAWLSGQVRQVHIHTNGLPQAGGAGTNYTWMDAKVDGTPVTPRAGTPVEVAALWLRALKLAQDLHRSTGLPLPAGCADALAHGKAAFAPLFFLEAEQHLADVISPDGTPDTRLRPNQCWAICIGVEDGFLPLDMARAALGKVESQLLTPVGLRTLAPGSPGYCPHYGGDPATRDRAYHQGTCWPWLVGPYVSAVLAVGGASGKKIRARALADYFAPLLTENSPARNGLGGLAEVFDAEKTVKNGQFTQYPEGCPWQAWSVAEVLRAAILAGALNGRPTDWPITHTGGLEAPPPHQDNP